MKHMENKTALQQLLHQMREERSKLPLLIECDRCYKAIEMVIVNTYLPIEKQQIVEAHLEGQCDNTEGYPLQISEKYYNETYGK
jgi:hypothetical protein